MLNLGHGVHDVNGDGVRQPAEPPKAGVQVFLDANNNGVLDAGEKNVTTGASGSHLFNGMAPGAQHVRVQPKLFYSNTAPAGGVYHLAMASGMAVGGKNFGEHFTPIIVPLPIPQPIPIPRPDPGPISLL